MAQQSNSTNITLFAKINNQLASVYPKTSADNVMYDDSSTVKDTIDSIIAEILRLENLLSIDSVYIRDSNGIVLDDGSGSNLVAVASLIANNETSSDS
jgi:hypothetical protein